MKTKCSHVTSALMFGNPTSQARGMAGCGDERECAMFYVHFSANVVNTFDSRAWHTPIRRIVARHLHLRRWPDSRNAAA